MALTMVVTAFLIGGTALFPGNAEEAKQRIQVGNEVCGSEQDYDRYETAMNDGTAAHEAVPGHQWHAPKSCFMIAYPARAFVLERPKPGKTKIRLLDGDHAGAIGWTDAWLPPPKPKITIDGETLTADQIICGTNADFVAALVAAKRINPSLSKAEMGKALGILSGDTQENEPGITLNDFVIFSLVEFAYSHADHIPVEASRIFYNNCLSFRSGADAN